MAVVINEFEVVAAPPPQTQPARKGPSGEKSSDAPPLRAADIVALMRRQAARQARLRAD